MSTMNSECFDECTTFVVELPVKFHNIPEVLQAKEKELNNLLEYETFEEVDDIGQETIGSRWVVTKKEAHDGQKSDYKARLVARGFQENTKPQADSPTALRESLKLFLGVAANEGFEVAAVDIRVAFLQSKGLDRDVFGKPPLDLKKENKVWKLKQSLYCLDDPSH